MAPTVAEILKQTGMSDEDIAKLDQRYVAGFQTILTTAEQAQQSAAQLKEQAETADRAQREIYDQKIAPALDKWGNEKSVMEAELAYHRTLSEQAKANGFIPRESPGFVAKPPVTPPGSGSTYVPNAGAVPGSPSFMTKEEGLRAVTNATWAITEHQRLHGQPIPDDIETLSAEAERRHLPFRQHVEEKYGFAGRRKEIVEKAQNEEIDRRVNEQVKEKERKLVEQFSSNPNVRQGAPSEFTNLKKGVEQKSVKDPLSMNKQERHQYTGSLIQNEIVQNANSSVN